MNLIVKSYGCIFKRFFGESGNLNKIRGWLQNPSKSEESRIWNYGKYDTYNYPQMEQIMKDCVQVRQALS